jgi:crossover junction endodeoxyribonuclease RusA
MLEARVRFVVDGHPASQGSMTAVYNRKLGVARVRHVAAPALSLWRSQCREAAKLAGAEVWEGPIAIRISFGLPAPLNQKHGYPKRPDLDKLVRGVLDALTGTCYRDDSQVVKIEAEKVWEPVTIIEVWRVERQSTKSTLAQATIWTDDAEGLGAYSEKGHRKG